MANHRAEPSRPRRGDQSRHRPATDRPDARRSAPRHRARPGRRRVILGLPTILGVLTLTVAGAGAVAPPSDFAHGALALSAHAPSSPDGTDAAGYVDSRRSLAVSRDSDRQALRKAQPKPRPVASSWHLPTRGYHLTARFGETSGLWSSFHTGLDFAAPTGTPIFAVASGKITETGWAGSYGNRTVETLPDGTELWYAHQSEIGVKVGQQVREGQTIGEVGSTGNTTGPHVHLEVRPGGRGPIDPYRALIAHGVHP
jgi:murein DD-endopeptidase MepM/ murein hydrolase activator NlpD